MTSAQGSGCYQLHALCSTVTSRAPISTTGRNLLTKQLFFYQQTGYRHSSLALSSISSISSFSSSDDSTSLNLVTRASSPSEATGTTKQSLEPEAEDAPTAAGGEGKASGTEAEEEEKYEEYEVVLDQPLGLKFAKGKDGATYIDAIGVGGSADKTGKFTVGDRVLATSAVFGDEIWPAAEYGRTMYTIRQRIGPLLMRMQKRYGNTDYTGELSEKEIIRAERNSGVISKKLRDIQMQNYMKKVEQKQQRENDLRVGLSLYRERKYEGAREKFESVLGSKPTPDESAVASYNVACCYSKLNQIKAGLSALEDALKAGFEDFKRIREDPDIAALRASPDFDPILKRFDESFINENAINAIKSLFGIFKK